MNEANYAELNVLSFRTARRRLLGGRRREVACTKESGKPAASMALAFIFMGKETDMKV